MQYFERAIPLRQRQVILDSLGKGNTLRGACRLAKIPYAVYKRWIVIGKQLVEHPEYDIDEITHEEQMIIDFYLDTEHRQAQHEAGLIAAVDTHSQTDWRAAMALLSKRNPGEWGNDKDERARIEADVTSAADNRINLDELSLEELEALDNISRKVIGKPAAIPALTNHQAQEVVILDSPNPSK